MTNNNDPITTAMIADANARRLADIRATPAPVMPDRPARRLPPRARRHSVPHRAIR